MLIFAVALLIIGMMTGPNYLQTHRRLQEFGFCHGVFLHRFKNVITYIIFSKIYWCKYLQPGFELTNFRSKFDKLPLGQHG